VETITAHRYRYCDEKQLHEGLAGALSAAGYTVEREVPLTAADRIDLLVGRVGIEVKLAGATPSVLRQLQRYARSDRLDSLLLVTTRTRHAQLPDHVGGKRLIVVSLLGGF
jgi:hypothetical protein